MARMIPTDGGYFDPKSKEKEMFDALSTLPDDYYVFHSYRLVNLIPDKGLNENEIDFLVFNPNYGCLFIECKNRDLKRENGQWQYWDRYTDGGKWADMHDPFDQAFSAAHNLFNKLKDLYPEYRSMINRCKFMVAVWLPKYTKSQVDDLIFGQNVTREIIMSREAMLFPDETKKQVQALMERMNLVHLVCKYEEEKLIDSAPGYRHTLTKAESMDLFQKVLCPTFRTIVNIRKEYEETYLELLEEQYVVLKFLAHQRTAAISGAGGTGKTLVAVHRAELLGEKGERVLFLCYNRNLAQDLEQKNKGRLKNVDFYTLDSLACKKCNTSWEHVSYYDLKEVLENEILEGTFEYQHIIVDEGQDFGRRRDDETTIKSDLLELLSEYGAGTFGQEKTSFFIFYDKNQLVNTKELPVYLQNVDSKLTLYQNCRNTKNIAETAYSLLTTAPVLHEHAWKGETASFIFYDSDEEMFKRLDNTIASLSDETNSSRVIISCCDSMNYSVLKERIQTEPDGRTFSYKSNGKKTRLYSVPTFKGLEADDVIITDLREATFAEGNCDFYVAASRAKKRLVIFIDRRKVNLEKVLAEKFPNSFPLDNKDAQLALAMHGIAK